MRSDAVKTGTQQAPHRSLFNALGMTKDQLKSLAISFGSEFSEVFSLFIEVANKIKDDISTKSF